jgi:hypothetical protein
VASCLSFPRLAIGVSLGFGTWDLGFLAAHRTPAAGQMLSF